MYRGEEPEPDCMKTSAQPRQAATNSKHSGGRLKALVRAQVRNKQASSHVKTLKSQILRYESSTLILCKELSSTILQSL